MLASEGIFSGELDHVERRFNVAAAAQFAQNAKPS